jgi:hypothetical protein
MEWSRQTMLLTAALAEFLARIVVLARNGNFNFAHPLRIGK